MGNSKEKGATILTRAENCLRPFDLLDGVIRRSVLAIFDKERDPQRPPLVGREGRLSQVQLAIGQQLRAEYDVAAPIPGANC